MKSLIMQTAGDSLSVARAASRLEMRRCLAWVSAALKTPWVEDDRPTLELLLEIKAGIESGSLPAGKL